jgi:hypothetical protein
MTKDGDGHVKVINGHDYTHLKICTNIVAP